MTTSILINTNLKIKKTLLMLFSIPLITGSHALGVLGCAMAAIDCSDLINTIIDKAEKPKLTPRDKQDVIIKGVRCGVSASICAGAP